MKFRILLPTLIVLTVLQPQTSAEEPHPFFDKPILFGVHRGGMKWRPEATIKLFKEDVANWPDIVLECDARVTKDGVAVLIHDGTVDRTTNGKGRVEDYTLAEIQSLDAGHGFSRDKGKTYPYRGQEYQIPTVLEALLALPNQRFLIEIKDQPGCAEALMDAVKKADAAHRVCIASFNPEQMKIAEKIVPDVATCFDSDSRKNIVEALRGSNWDSYVPEDDLVIFNYHRLRNYGITEKDFPTLQAKGIALCAYTINKEEEMRHLISIGIDSMLTDRPDILGKVLLEQK
jgi:glycerophosphoryl diester phosphodiesterase